MFRQTKEALAIQATIEAARLLKCDIEPLWELTGGEIEQPLAVIETALIAATKPNVWASFQETTAKHTWFALNKWAAWTSQPELAVEIAKNRPGGEIQIPEIEKLLWLAGGAENAPGLIGIIKRTQPRNWGESMKAATWWRATNVETEDRRKEIIKKTEPDYNPATQKWGSYLKKRLEISGINLARKPPKTKGTKPDLTTRILGESHKLSETGEFLIKEVEAAAKQGFDMLTVEEPCDGSWKDFTAFLTSTKKTWSAKKILEAAKAYAGEGASANRLAALAVGRNNGMKISFVDLPSQEKARRFRWEITNRGRRVAHGEPFDPTRPETTEGGVRALAASILWGYKAARSRSRVMAKTINVIQKKSKVLHIGGTLHAEDVALELQRLRPEKGLPQIIFGPTKPNPLLEALGKTKQSQSKKKSGPEIEIE